MIIIKRLQVYACYFFPVSLKINQIYRYRNFSSSANFRYKTFYFTFSCETCFNYIRNLKLYCFQLRFITVRCKPKQASNMLDEKVVINMSSET
jgi:hypothetical protein